MENAYLYQATVIVLLHISTKIANKQIVPQQRPRVIPSETSARLKERSEALKDASVNLQAAILKMRAANEKLAARMAEHKAFFDKYRPET